MQSHNTLKKNVTFIGVLIGGLINPVCFCDNLYLGLYIFVLQANTYTRRASKRHRVLFAVVWPQPGVVCYHTPCAFCSGVV